MYPLVGCRPQLLCTCNEPEFQENPTTILRMRAWHLQRGQIMQIGAVLQPEKFGGWWYFINCERAQICTKRTRGHGRELTGEFLLLYRSHRQRIFEE